MAMGLRGSLVGVGVCAVLWVGCGDDGGPSGDAGEEMDAGVGGDSGTGMDAGMDAGRPDDGAAPTDGGMDAGPTCESEVGVGPGTLLVDAGTAVVTVSGRVMTPPRRLPDPCADGGAIDPDEIKADPGECNLDGGSADGGPDASAPSDAGVQPEVFYDESSGRVQGVEVTLRGPEGEVLARDLTDCQGRYEFPAPANTSPVFVEVEPVDGRGGGYTGYVRARETDTRDLDVGRLFLLLVPELRWRLGHLGMDYDESKGWIVQSFASPRTDGGGLPGGEGITVTGTPNGPSFVVTGTRTLERNTLPPECDQGDSGVPRGEPVLGPDGGVVCYTDLLELVFVSNVDPTTGARIELTSPDGLTCEQRQSQVQDWLVEPNSVTRVRADCN
jgi:hypothetical protein